MGFLMLHTPRVDQNPLFRADLASMLEHLQTALAPAFEEYKIVIYQQLTDYGKDMEFFKGTSLEPDLVTMSACVCFGIFNFVADKFAKEPQLCSRVTNVNSLVCSMRRISAEGFFEYSAMPMLKLLLGHGVDPNSSFDGKTEWGFILEDLISEGEDRRRLKSFEGIKSLLRHGADFELQFTPRTGKKGAVKANELLKEWFDADQFGVLEDIIKRRASKTKKSQTISKKMRHFKLWMASKK